VKGLDSADGSGLHIGIAVASWNQSVTDALLEGARTRCSELGVAEVTVMRVPGALELPLAASALCKHGCDGVIAIGVVIKGDTDHYDIVVRESSGGVSRVALDTGIPVTNAILAAHRIEDAMDRAGPGDANKGAEAATAAVLMANAMRGL
jgi:6,7-dimethyl-8-ribityllumazine synthase